MTITQTVEVPASRRLTIDVPHEIPAGELIIAFTPIPANSAKKSDTVADISVKYNTRDVELINQHAEQLNKEALDVLSYQNLYPEDTLDL